MPNYKTLDLQPSLIWITINWTLPTYDQSLIVILAELTSSNLEYDLRLNTEQQYTLSLFDIDLACDNLMDARNHRLIDKTTGIPCTICQFYYDIDTGQNLMKVMTQDENLLGSVFTLDFVVDIYDSVNNAPLEVDFVVDSDILLEITRTVEPTQATAQNSIPFFSPELS